MVLQPSDAPMEVTVSRVSRPMDLHRFTIAARSSRRLPNVLRELGGGEAGDGTRLDGLIIESPYRAGAQLSVYSRIYTPSPEGGSYGQAVPALPSVVGYSNHLAPGVWPNQISETESVFPLDRRDPNRFRHNIGIVNTGDEPVTLAFGSVARPPELVVAPHSVQQYSLEAVIDRPPEPLPSYIEVNATKPVALWLSIVDNLTNDASFIPFTLYGVEVHESVRLAIPVIATTSGAEGSRWYTDGYGFFAYRVENVVQSPDANFYPATGMCAGGTATRKLTPNGIPNEPNAYFGKVIFENLTGQMCAGVSPVSGGLEVRTGSWTSMFTRTYTTRADGGTYGDILPLYPPRGWPVRHFAGIESTVMFGSMSASTTPRMFPRAWS